jgi:hypothetical protein
MSTEMERDWVVIDFGTDLCCQPAGILGHTAVDLVQQGIILGIARLRHLDISHGS